MAFYPSTEKIDMHGMFCDEDSGHFVRVLFLFLSSFCFPLL